MSTWSTLRLGTKLSLATFLLTVALMVAFIVVLGRVTAEVVEHQAEDAVGQQKDVLLRMLRMTEAEVQNRTETLGTAFRSTVGEVELEDGALRSVGAEAPFDVSRVDGFTATTGAVATVFVASSGEFVRLATSLKDEAGRRATGTALDRAHPAFRELSAGKRYVGIARVFGRTYMTQYDPLRDAKGAVVGATFVGLDLQRTIDDFKTAIRSVKVGKTGYFYVLDASTGPNRGTLVVHPAMEGKNILESKDASGRPFIREILDRGAGQIRYPWINKDKGETRARDKVVAFDRLDGLGWAIGGGAYLDELTSELVALRGKLLALGVTVALFMAGALWVVVRALVSRPLAEVIRAADRIAQGDLTRAVETTRGDEIGELFGAINKTSAGLSTLVEAMRDAAHELSRASSELAEGNTELATRTEEQARALRQTADTMGSVSAGATANSESAESAASLASEVSEIARKAGGDVTKAVDSMKAMNESSRLIGDIIDVMNGIAFQTNILALNAAVEAARAGDHGAGFAVVASEVRTLASKSSEASKRIASLVKANLDQAEQGARIVDKAGSSMVDVVEATARVTSHVSSISHASQEQTRSVSDVDVSLSQMNDVTARNAALVEQMAAAADALSGRADELLRAVGAFRTTSGAGAAPGTDAETEDAGAPPSERRLAA